MTLWHGADAPVGTASIGALGEALSLNLSDLAPASPKVLRLPTVLTASSLGEFEGRLAALQEKRIEEAQILAARIDELQEKRVNEAHEMVREAMTILQDTKQSVDRITTAMEALRDVVRR